MSAGLPPALGQSLVKGLGEGCGVAAKAARILLCFAGMPLEEADFRREGIQSVENGRLLHALHAFRARGWCEVEAACWKSTPAMPESLPVFLEGAAAVRFLDGPVVRARAVITMPGSESLLRAALPSTGLAYAALEDTRETFLDLAGRASRSLSVLTPFLNSAGITWACDLFEATPAPSRELITRLSPELYALLLRHSARFRYLGVRVLDYRLPRPDGGYETFHAKAIVADDHVAYVGSANLLEYERQSMELGILVEGSPVHAVSGLLEAIRGIAIPITFPVETYLA